MFPLPEKPKFVGIGGWLILVTVGTVLRPVRLAAELWQSLFGILFGNVFLHQVDDLLSPERALLFFALVQAEVFLIAFLLGISLLTVVLLFRKDRWFPALSIVLLAIQVGFAAYALALGSWFPEMEMDQELNVLAGAVLGALVWIPYLLISKRVKATFRR